MLYNVFSIAEAEAVCAGALVSLQVSGAVLKKCMAKEECAITQGGLCSYITHPQTFSFVRRRRPSCLASRAGFQRRPDTAARAKIWGKVGYREEGVGGHKLCKLFKIVHCLKEKLIKFFCNQKCVFLTNNICSCVYCVSCLVSFYLPLRLRVSLSLSVFKFVSQNDWFPLCPRSTDTQCKTTAKADIVLLVDGSWSIGRLNFKTIRSFISRMLGIFDIGPDKVQIGETHF